MSTKNGRGRNAIAIEIRPTGNAFDNWKPPDHHLRRSAVCMYRGMHVYIPVSIAGA